MNVRDLFPVKLKSHNKYQQFQTATWSNILYSTIYFPEYKDGKDEHHMWQEINFQCTLDFQ